MDFFFNIFFLIIHEIKIMSISLGKYSKPSLVDIVHFSSLHIVVNLMTLKHVS